MDTSNDLLSVYTSSINDHGPSSRPTENVSWLSYTGIPSLQSTFQTQTTRVQQPNFPARMTTSPTEMPLATASTTSILRQTKTAITTAVPTSSHTQAAPRLSSSAIMGIGVAAGVIGILTLVTSGLLIYRCWKRRQSPEVRYYRQARLWKGFTPATPSTARTTLTESKMANIYFGELRSPATPAFIFSPPLGRAGQGWPDTPLERRSTMAERSV